MTEQRSARGFTAWPWHPVLFAVVIVLSLWLGAAVSFFAVLRALALAIVFAVGLTLLLGIPLRSWQRGGIAATVVIGMLWSKELIHQASDLAGRMGPVAILWGALIVAAAALAVRLARRARVRLTAGGLTSVLNRAAALLLLATVLLGVLQGGIGMVAKDGGQGVDLASWEKTRGTGTRSTGEPDIYVILLDGYPRADALEYAFGLDNTPFTDALADRGFQVATASHSDYLWTHVSVPSALNMDYVENVPAMDDVANGRSPRQPTLRWTIADNAAFAEARDHGYTPIAVGSGFEEVAPRLADVYVDGGQLNEFEISLLNQTFLADILGAVAPDFASAQQRDRITFNLDVLPRIAAAAGDAPVLVFAHVPAPHQPTVFGEDGAGVAVPLTSAYFADSPLERGEDPTEFADRYRAQLPYLNQLVLAAVDGILAASSEPPVIVLFADHGSASAVDWNATDPADANPARLLERTATLFAALTPGHPDAFPNDISPVDIFRLLSDAYFGTDHGRATPPAGGGQVPRVDASVFDH